MRRPFFNRGLSHLLIRAVVIALVCRALIPAGFMPAADGSFALQICRSGFLVAFDAHEPLRNSGGHSHVEYCPFGALPGAAPLSHIVAFQPSWLPVSEPVAERAVRRAGERADRAHLPRGPPALA